MTAGATGKISQRRLTKYRLLIDKVIELYTADGRQDRVELWAGLKAEAEASITAGTATDFDFKDAGLI